MRGKKWLIGSLLVAATGILGACDDGNSAESGSGREVTLAFWNGFTASDGEILQEIVNGFNKTNDKSIKIEMDIMTWANLNEKLPTAISSKKAPDFIALNYPDFAQYVEDGVVQPLDDFWEYDGVGKSDFKETAIELGEAEGKQYFVPMQVQGMYMYWNNDLFKQAGLDTKQPPTTWEELTEMAPKLIDSSKNVSGFIFNKDRAAPLCNWTLANGGKLVNDDYTESEFTSLENLKTLKAIQEMIHVDKAGPESISGAEMDNLVNVGQLAIEINGLWLNNGLKTNETDYNVTTLPQGSDSDKKTVILDGVGYVIPASTDNNKKEVVYELLKYWNTTEIGKKWDIKNGFPAYLDSVVKDEKVENDSIVSELPKQMDYVESYLSGLTQISVINNNIINPLIEKLLAGEDPETLMNDADDAINQLLQK